MLDADKVYNAIVQSAKDWAVADEKWRNLKEMDSIILAEIINHQSGESFAERKSKALASPEYKLHKVNLVSSKTEANIKLAMYKAAQNLAELRRTEESSRRAEMGIR
jgi:hypothetical protein